MTTKKFLGKPIKGIDLLKFIRCPMSDFHYKTYLELTREEERIMSKEANFTIDMALPDMTLSNPFKSLGIVSRQDIALKLPPKNDSLKYVQKDDSITGSMLNVKSLHTISSKYSEMIKKVH